MSFNISNNLSADIVNLLFQFDDKTTLFNGLNFRINPLDKIAIIGESGTGKSTLINLILGFLHPTSGNIIIRERQSIIDPRDYSKVFFPNVSYLAQSPFIPVNDLYDYIRDRNMTGRKSDIERIIDISHSFGVENIVKIVIDNKHKNTNYLYLSGGQKQRLGLVATLAEDRDIVILDEPTSALDKETAYKVMKNICKCRKTLICITHNRSILPLFDKIISL